MLKGTKMFNGLSAFPLTPLVQGEPDEKAFGALIETLVAAGVNSVGALGSTGSYAYLTREQRFAVTKLAVSAAAGVPVMTSIGSVNAEMILRLAEDAQSAGVKGLLLAPLSYQKLTADEVFRLYERVAGKISVRSVSTITRRPADLNSPMNCWWRCHFCATWVLSNLAICRPIWLGRQPVWRS
jgi:dihydrodipicolinate synthase/N-acetylneuraminate lyase